MGAIVVQQSYRLHVSRAQGRAAGRQQSHHDGLRHLDESIVNGQQEHIGKASARGDYDRIRTWTVVIRIHSGTCGHKRHKNVAALNVG